MMGHSDRTDRKALVKNLREVSLTPNKLTPRGWLRPAVLCTATALSLIHCQSYSASAVIPPKAASDTNAGSGGACATSGSTDDPAASGVSYMTSSGSSYGSANDPGPEGPRVSILESTASSPSWKDPSVSVSWSGSTSSVNVRGPYLAGNPYGYWDPNSAESTRRNGEYLANIGRGTAGRTVSSSSGGSLALGGSASWTSIASVGSSLGMGHLSLGSGIRSYSSPRPVIANPINPAPGNKYEIETDYAGEGPFPLMFQRSYNSINLANDGATPERIGSQWRGFYDRFISAVANQPSPTQRVSRPDGQSLSFTFSNGQWVGGSDVVSRLVQTTDTGGNPSGWKLVTGDDTVEIYDLNGRLLSITTRAGLSQTLSYDAAGRLSQVTDPAGRTLSFGYDAQNRVATMIDPAGGRYFYSYDENGNLISVR